MFDIKAYHRYLCPSVPPFLDAYLRLPLLQRLKGVGLLCGTDWTPLFHNRFYYSRYDHSVGVALIIWNFTHDKKQTIAGLLHDVSTPAFSHVLDFRNGDALTQESTEDLNAVMVDSDAELCALLKADGLTSDQVNDYHIYPIADNAMPGLSSDRLEYMYPSGAALDDVWSMDEIKKSYDAVRVLSNENGVEELGFCDVEQAVIYTKKFCDVSLLLQHNEDKIAMQLMADVLSRAAELSILQEDELYSCSEAVLMDRFESFARSGGDVKFSRLFGTYTKMDRIIRSDVPLDDCYCISLDVKKRYVDPLTLNAAAQGNCARRVSEVDGRAKKYIEDFLAYNDSRYGCVPWRD